MQEKSSCFIDAHVSGNATGSGQALNSLISRFSNKCSNIKQGTGLPLTARTSLEMRKAGITSCHGRRHIGPMAGNLRP